MKILVTGATGTVGTHLVEQLIQTGIQVRALTRNPAKANFPNGVEVVAGDLTMPTSLTPALEGITGLHLINFGGGTPLQTGNEIMELAEKAGVKRVTVLRGGPKGALEQAVESSKLTWTFLQPVEFMSGILEWAPSIRAEGVVRQPFSNRKTAIVHEADIASVAARVLGEDSHAGKTYSITGPEVLTPREMVRIISATTGHNIQFIELTEAQAREQWRAAGTPPEVIEFLVWAYGNTPPVGYTLSPAVEQVTGRPPRTFAQWAAEHSDDFRNGVQRKD